MRRHLLLCLMISLAAYGASAAPPVITSVVNAANFTGPVASGAWVTIFGTDLASTTRAWGPNDFVGGNLPAALDGVSVTINGLSAYVYYVSPTQVNVLAPSDSSLGSVNVQVTAPGGVSSPFSVTKTVTSPAFFQFAPQGARYIIAVNSDGTYAGPPSLFGGAPASRPSIRGEVVVLYATGLGATAPGYPDGQILSTNYPLAATPRVTIGGQPAAVQYAGLVMAGLYQLNVVIPQLAGGDQSVMVDLGNGVTSQPGVSYIAIAGSPVTSANWVQLLANPTSEGPHNLALLSDYEIFVALRSGGVLRSVDRGQTWSDVSPAAGVNCQNFLRAGSKLLVSCSGNAGAVFLWTGSGWTAGSNSPNVIAQMVYTPDGQIIALFSKLARIGFSRDGVNWTFSPLPGGLGLIQVLQRNPVTGDLWLGTEAAGVYRSTDGGSTFAYAGNKPGQAGGPVNGATFIFGSDGSTMYAEHAAVYKWVPASNSWSSLATGAEGVPGIPSNRQIESTLLLPNGVLYVGTGQSYSMGNSYVYESHDNGASYSLTNIPGLPNAFRVSDLEIDSQGYLWAGMRDGGVWRAYVGP